MGSALTAILRSKSRTLCRYAAALALCLLVLGITFDIGPMTRQSPYFYQGDTMFYQLLTKNIVDHGWVLEVPRLGAPGTLNLRDVPMSDNNLHLLMLRLLAVTSSHYPTVLNNFFLLGFPLIFLASLSVLRHFGVSWPTSVMASLLYAFAPFHIARGEHHLFLSAYWPVPLAVLVTLWVSGDAFSQRADARPAWRNRKLWLSVAICAVLAATGFYYAFFACCFLVVAGGIAAVRDRRWRRLIPAVGLVAVIGMGLAINLSPTLVHFEEHGSVPMVRRRAGDADQYGLRIAQLLLPVRGHRVEALADLKTRYNRRPLINENDDIALGMAGAIGFLGLLWWFFFRKPAAQGLTEPGAEGLLHRLSMFNLAGLLLGTMGGFGSLVAFFGLPQVRSYNRIGVFLSFFALFALALWLDRFARRYVTSGATRVAFGCGLAIATVLALCDQISPKMLPDYPRLKRQFTSDAAFVREIEMRVPRGASIFQLPFMTFPESLPLSRMKDYGLLRGHVHSTHLRWSYGTIRGREENAWWRQAAAKPVNQLVETLAWAGFNGIYLDRTAFDDDGARMVCEFDQVLEHRIGSADQTLVFYDLSEYQARLQQRTPREQWAGKREEALHPPLIVWRDGFSDPEGTADTTWRWGGSRGRIELINRASRPRHVHLQMTVGSNRGGNVMIEGPLLGRPLKMDRNRGHVDQTFVLPPGRHPINFASDAPPDYPPNDFRDLVFLVSNPRLTPVQ